MLVYPDWENEDMPDRKIWVLVVDDNLVVRKTTGKLLRKEGFEIILAEDGEEAMGLIELCTPDCIVLDLLMPKVHGHGFLTWLRKKNKTLPVIVVSGIEQQSGLVSAIESLGIAGWVSKPGNPKEVAKMIRKAVKPNKEQPASANLKTTTRDN
jgi:DNA-binding response OmpR family regulator